MQVQASKREQDLQQSHKLYILLKNYIEKLPSYKVKEDLVETQVFPIFSKSFLMFNR